MDAEIDPSLLFRCYQTVRSMLEVRGLICPDTRYKTLEDLQHSIANGMKRSDLNFIAAEDIEARQSESGDIDSLTPKRISVFFIDDGTKSIQFL